MRDTEAAITAALGDLERACVTIERAKASLVYLPGVDRVFGLDEASHAAHLALLALRESYRDLALVGSDS